MGPRLDHGGSQLIEFLIGLFLSPQALAETSVPAALVESVIELRQQVESKNLELTKLKRESAAELDGLAARYKETQSALQKINLQMEQLLVDSKKLESERAEAQDSAQKTDQQSLRASLRGALQRVYQEKVQLGANEADQTLKESDTEALWSLYLDELRMVSEMESSKRVLTLGEQAKPKLYEVLRLGELGAFVFHEQPETVQFLYPGEGGRLIPVESSTLVNEVRALNELIKKGVRSGQVKLFSLAKFLSENRGTWQ